MQTGAHHWEVTYAKDGNIFVLKILSPTYQDVEKYVEKLGAEFIGARQADPVR